jgi:fumarate reductase subunit C
VQDNAYIEQGWFERKEGNYFAYLRSTQTVPALSGEYPLRSVTGIGNSLTVDSSTPSATLVNFSINPLISIGNIISVGDYLYFTTADVPVYCGVVTNVVQNYRANQNYIEVDTTVTSGNVPPTNTEFFLFVKNQIAESLGILGGYAIIDLENDSTSKVEIFTIETQIQKSYP